MSFARPIRPIKVKQLPSPVQRALMRAFAQTDLMDLYHGDVVMYLDVIRGQLRDAQQENRKLHAQMDRIAELARLKTASRNGGHK